MTPKSLYDWSTSRKIKTIVVIGVRLYGTEVATIGKNVYAGL